MLSYWAVCALFVLLTTGLVAWGFSRLVRIHVTPNLETAPQSFVVCLSFIVLLPSGVLGFVWGSEWLHGRLVSLGVFSAEHAELGFALTAFSALIPSISLALFVMAGLTLTIGRKSGNLTPDEEFVAQRREDLKNPSNHRRYSGRYSFFVYIVDSIAFLPKDYRKTKKITYGVLPVCTFYRHACCASALPYNLQNHIRYPFHAKAAKPCVN